MKNLEKEAELLLKEYIDFDDLNGDELVEILPMTMHDYAVSFARAKVIQGQIDVLTELKYPDQELSKMKGEVLSVAVIFNIRIDETLNKLKQQLKELEQ